MNNNDLDKILQQALSPIEPDENLNKKIRLKLEEKSMGNVKKKLSIKIATLVAAATLILGSVTAFAAWKYLSLGTVAEKVSNHSLSSAFNSSTSIKINETQKYGDYKITLLGIVSGKDLTDFVSMDEHGNIFSDRSYIVVAIENADGKPMPSSKSADYGKQPFFVSPLISGLNPNEYNSTTMNGGYSEFVNDGVLYRIAECDNVEAFADHDLYVCVLSNTFYDNNAYNYNNQTGKITRNNNYDGVNALFNLPLDKSKANKNAADEYIKKLKSSWEENSKEDADTSADIFGTWDEERLKTDATLDKNSVKTLTPDKDGYIHYYYENDFGTQDLTLLVSGFFTEDQVGMSPCMSFTSSNPEEHDKFDTITTYTRNKDGTITVAVYIPNK